jgi:hypothetical protein
MSLSGAIPCDVCYTEVRSHNPFPYQVGKSYRALVRPRQVCKKQCAHENTPHRSLNSLYYFPFIPRRHLRQEDYYCRGPGLLNSRPPSHASLRPCLPVLQCFAVFCRVACSNVIETAHHLQIAHSRPLSFESLRKLEAVHVLYFRSVFPQGSLQL